MDWKPMQDMDSTVETLDLTMDMIFVQVEPW